ncbi:hypothetical protein PIB30_063646 [Stylosanthes scabra]|uniref:Uncharacterized protein n=1 Tax=Stylosanthes scabra TaxID=79078 RepID=A0ABU6VL95_9FABA|nr:hypothetical protein [Stylosanthes scabra]
MHSFASPESLLLRISFHVSSVHNGFGCMMLCCNVLCIHARIKLTVVRSDPCEMDGVKSGLESESDGCSDLIGVLGVGFTRSSEEEGGDLQLRGKSGRRR